jgi:hypothetical protein
MEASFLIAEETSKDKLKPRWIKLIYNLPLGSDELLAEILDKKALKALELRNQESK